MSKNRVLDRNKVIEALFTIREEWEFAVDGKPLDSVDGCVGLLLADVAKGIGLTLEEQKQVLGSSLAQSVPN